MQNRKSAFSTRALSIIKNPKGIALAASLVVSGGLVAAASGATGAYFTDTQDGNITATLGSIHVQGGGNLVINDLLPGQPRTVSTHFKNTGASNQDVWVVFPNATALSAFNNIGSYGHFAMAASGNSIFDSSNLNDRYADGTPGGDKPDIYPLHRAYKVASNLAPNEGGDVSFTFNYAGKMTHQEGAFNHFPQSDQKTIIAADGSGDGLPYQIVATQVGQQP